MERETLQTPDKKGKIEASREVERGRRERETEIEREGARPDIDVIHPSLSLSVYLSPVYTILCESASN